MIYELIESLNLKQFNKQMAFIRYVEVDVGVCKVIIDEPNMPYIQVFLTKMTDCFDELIPSLLSLFEHNRKTILFDEILYGVGEPIGLHILHLGFLETKITIPVYLCHFAYDRRMLGFRINDSIAAEQFMMIRGYDGNGQIINQGHLQKL